MTILGGPLSQLFSVCCKATLPVPSRIYLAAGACGSTITRDLNDAKLVSKTYRTYASGTLVLDVLSREASVTSSTLWLRAQEKKSHSLACYALEFKLEVERTFLFQVITRIGRYNFICSSYSATGVILS